jgi:hypothetical protein
MDLCCGGILSSGIVLQFSPNDVRLTMNWMSSMWATDYGIDGGYESKGKVHFEVVQRITNTKHAMF